MYGLLHCRRCSLVKALLLFFYWATDSDESGLATWKDLLNMPQEQLSSHVSLQFSGRAPTHLDIVIENKKFSTFRHCSLLGVLLILGILAVGGAQVPSCLPSGGCRLASKFNLEFWALASSSRGQILWFWCFDQLNLARHPGLEPMHNAHPPCNLLFFSGPAVVTKNI